MCSVQALEVGWWGAASESASASQGARAAENGQLAPPGSGGGDGEGQRQPEAQTSQPASSDSPQHTGYLPAHSPRAFHEYLPFDADLDLDSAIASAFPPTTADDDHHGAGNMLVASSGELQHHVHAYHDTRDALSSPPHTAASHEPVLNMEVATADAGAQDAPSVPTPDAPAAQDMAGLGNGLPALGDPIAFPQPPDMNGVAMGMHMDMGMDLGMGMNVGMVPPDFAAMDLTQPTAIRADERLTAFARLRFDDGSYYMHTYQIMLGRNIELAHRDMRRLAKVDQLRTEGDPQAADILLNGKTSKKSKRRAARSVISERGGIVSAPIASMPLEYQQRRQSNASHSLSSASHPTGDSGEEKPAERAPQNMIMQAFPEVPPQFDGHVPEDPNDCPLVPIHPHHITTSTGSHGPKGISREHARIFYNLEEGHFCIEVLGSNGLHHENVFRYQGDIVPLDHGDRLVIGAVNFQFYLPDIALTEDQRHRQESGSRPMSFSFENGHGELETDEQISSDSEGELSINPRHVYHYPVDSDIESADAVGDDDLDDYEEPVPRARQKPQKIKLKLSNRAPPPKEVKSKHKRKEREVTPEERPHKKLKKSKHKESHREPIKEAKEPKAAKEPKVQKEAREPKEMKEIKDTREPKEKGKAPAKTSSKTPVKEEEPVVVTPRETPLKEKPDPPKAVPNDSPPLLRKPLEGELEAGGEIEGLITEEMARHHNLPATLIGQVVEKRKGPGRPPKDGIMSKRQRSQLIKQAKETERAKAAGIDPADIPMPSMKPKIVKRKDSNAFEGEDGDVLESTENGDGTSGDRKLMKPSKPPRTPSPEPRMEDYTEEQLQRPTANYVVLIHEAISSSPTGQMNLQQIYNYIERKYPWYKFKTTTSGWQSSVRHNLGQHDAFVKGDKEGKGFNWKVNQEVSIEKERRKRQVSQQSTGRPTYPAQPQQPPQIPHASDNVSVGRYLATTHPDLIRQLEAFRKVYLEARTEPGEDRKVDNAIRAYVDPQFPRERLTTAEVGLFQAISGIEDLKKYNTNEHVQQAPTPVHVPTGPSTTSPDTAAAIAADAAANTITPPTATQHSYPSTNAAPQNQPSIEPQRYTPNMAALPPGAPPSAVLPPHVPSLPPSHRPSVEPLTPVPDSPAMPNGTLPKRSFAEVSATMTDMNGSTGLPRKVETDEPAEQVPKVETSSVGKVDEKSDKLDDAPTPTG
ncbi:hypothetical protein CC86DRAFT_280306 [Ophiobolus disseminans]|uniref:Fork-head domain-containing protein n=1 Tax=Ophiobolus disseminans TaxID=1469910 RepID=A0A6A7AIB8_9PLEO|nr:hypothetical protein CC86DRAFT_280306 [Ophiobolus disseminans]